MIRFKATGALRAWTLAAMTCLTLAATAPAAAQVQVQVGSVSGEPGESVVVPITFSSTPTSPADEIISFSITLSVDPQFAEPTVEAGADQSNITSFVDTVAGEFRVTGLALSAPNVGDGEILRLTFVIPGASASGDFPVTVTALEVRDTGNGAVAAMGNAGNINVNNAPTIVTTGGVGATEGAASVMANVATVADAEDLASTLAVDVLSAPAGINVGLLNTAGTIEATVSIDCGVAAGIHVVQLRVTDSGGMTATTNINVTVTANSAPTLGIYAPDPAPVVQGMGTNVIPGSAPADVDGNIATVEVSPLVLPGGGTVEVDGLTGVVTVTTTGGTSPGDHAITVTVTDTCGLTAVRAFTLRVEGPPIVVMTGGLTTTQGGPTANGPVATVSDGEDAAGTLGVVVSGAPAGLIVTALNTGGTVSAMATADCELAVATYSITLTVTDSDGLQTQGMFDVVVNPNPAPTLGAYGPLFVAISSSGMASPAAAPADANDNIATVVVAPSVLPGGGTVTVDPATGDVTVTTTATTTLGLHVVTVTVTDDCGDFVTQDLSITVTSGLAGDEDNDGAVSLAELNAAIGAFRLLLAAPATADLDGNGVVSFQELTAVLLAFRASP